MAQTHGSLSINSDNIFPIIKKWLYSDHDIFYRELISNGCDAITKLKKLEMMGEYELPEGYKDQIRVVLDPKEKTIQIMAANGYVIVLPNRRGLPGFGSAWNEEISGDWTGQCMNDYLSAIDDAANNLPYVDKDRLGCVGASFGGFSVYYLAGHHNKRFKAFLAHDGAFNLESMYTDTEEAWFSNWEYEDAYWNKDLSANAKKTYENSPHKFVDNIK